MAKSKVGQTVESLGDYLKEQRVASRLSLRQLAQQAGVSNPYLSQIERGLRKPSAEVLQQIAKALRISAEQLYIRAGIVSPDDGVGGSVEIAVLGDTGLTERQKQSLLDVYSSFIAMNDAARVTRRVPTPTPAATATTRPARHHPHHPRTTTQGELTWPRPRSTSSPSRSPRPPRSPSTPASAPVTSPSPPSTSTSPTCRRSSPASRRTPSQGRRRPEDRHRLRRRSRCAPRPSSRQGPPRRRRGPRRRAPGRGQGAPDQGPDRRQRERRHRHRHRTYADLAKRGEAVVRGTKLPSSATVEVKVNPTKPAAKKAPVRKPAAKTATKPAAKKTTAKKAPAKKAPAKKAPREEGRRPATPEEHRKTRRAAHAVLSRPDGVDHRHGPRRYELRGPCCVLDLGWRPPWASSKPRASSRWWSPSPSSPPRSSPSSTRCSTRRAYEAAGKLTKTTWCTILGLGVVLQFVSSRLLHRDRLALLIAALVYLADVRPALVACAAADG